MARSYLLGPELFRGSTEAPADGNVIVGLPQIGPLVASGSFNMAPFPIVLQLVLLILPLASSLKFDLQAHTGHSSKYERCIRNFVGKDTLVLVTAIVSGNKGDGQMVNMHVCYAGRLHKLVHGNEVMAANCCYLPSDQRCCGQRIRQAERSRWRDSDGIHFSRRFGFRCLL